MLRAELVAVIILVEKMEGRSVESDAAIHTDCAYVRRRCVKGPGGAAASSNADLWERL